MGHVLGDVSYDTVVFGTHEIQNQAFATVYKTADLGLSSSGTSGIMGLCFPASAAISPTAGSTLLQNLMSSVPEPVFAFHLPRMSGSADPNASFTIGALDPQFVPDRSMLQILPVESTGLHFDYWKISILRFTVNGVPFELSQSRMPGAATPIAVLDSGTTLILGPNDDVNALYQLLGDRAQYSPGSGWQVPCTLPVLVGIVMGNPPREYIIHPEDFSWSEAQSGEWCLGGIQGNDRVNAADWLFGDTALRNLYVAHFYDPVSPKIGLLNLTDPDAALAEFVQVRGPDLDAGNGADDAEEDEEDDWRTATGFVKRWEHQPDRRTTMLFAATAGGAGFIVGGLGVIGWRSWRGF
uniref:Peptidase A1 domain-containing protein n=1 Tax=Mycena chlorophos TaxID=658473 RepID=A0ABQ0M8I1_MYCCL|nr:predicted protein [Mycena chlorophos]